jgi:hypothetical protein
LEESVNKKLGIRHAIACAFLAASAVSGVALAVEEAEDNYPIQSAQRLTVGADGSVTINGIVGTLAGPLANDVDFYSFYARKGDVLVIDIDGAYKPSGPARISVDTYLTVFDSDLKVKRANDDKPLPLDDGSVSRRDAYIDNFTVEKDGVHYVGVTAFPRLLVDGGAIYDRGGVRYNGDYRLTISGVSPELRQINIDIKPGGGAVAPINPKSRGGIPVALLSADDFNALNVDVRSLTFGSTGDERSLQRCGKGGEDVNGDGRLDLVCHFETQAASFGATDLEGIVKGKGGDGMRFEGRGLLKVIPPMKAD